MNTAALPSPQEPATGLDYTKRLSRLGQARFAVFFLAVLFYAILGCHVRVASLAQRLTGSFYLQIALCWIALWTACAAASLPISVFHYRLERKFSLINAGMGRWLSDFAKSSAMLFLFTGTVIEIAFASDMLIPAYGWIVAGAACALLFVVVSRSMLWLLSLFYPVLPLNDPALRERLTRLAKRVGLNVGTLYQWRISSRTRRVNALVTGIGSARRILLTDTLVAELSEDEVEAIVAHELGHCALHHVLTRLLLQGFIYCGIVFIINLAVLHDLVPFSDENLGWRNLTLVPGFLLLWSFGQIYGSLLMTSLSRRQEKAADLYSWNLMGRAEPFITAMRKTAALNLIVFSKRSEWKYTHPATADRIAAAQAFAKANGEVTASSGSAVAIGTEAN